MLQGGGNLRCSLLCHMAWREGNLLTTLPPWHQDSDRNPEPHKVLIKGKKGKDTVCIAPSP